MFGLFKRVKEQVLLNAVLAFSGSFYKSLRQKVDTSSVDLLALQMEYPIMAISVANTFIVLRKPNARKLMATNTMNASMAYATHFEGLTKGYVSAENYQLDLVKRLEQGQGMEYNRIICEEQPEDQPTKLIRHFLERAGASMSNSMFEEANEELAESLSHLIDGLRRAGV